MTTIRFQGTIPAGSVYLNDSRQAQQRNIALMLDLDKKKREINSREIEANIFTPEKIIPAEIFTYVTEHQGKKVKYLGLLTGKDAQQFRETVEDESYEQACREAAIKTFILNGHEATRQQLLRLTVLA